MSDTRMTSARKSSRCSLRKAFKLGEPISSSPSKMNFTLWRSKPSRTMYSNAFTCIMACPLSSSAPRAQIRPSRISGSKGWLFQSSNGSAGITFRQSADTGNAYQAGEFVEEPCLVFFNVLFDFHTVVCFVFTTDYTDLLN